MSTLRLKLLAPLGIAALALWSCSSQPTQQEDAQMKAEAARAFNQMRASMPLVTDRPTIDFVACVAQAVVAQLEPPYNDIEWELAIFEAESVNAFAMPGGKIGVFSGILAVTENQDQLATVIGHEIAHVTAQHSKNRAQSSELTNLGINVAAILLGGGYTGTTYTAQQALAAGAQFGITLPHTRGQESEADVIGLEYMARAGFDPRESVPLWQRMDGSSGRKPAEFMSTHPSSETRIENLVSQWQKTLPLYNEARANGYAPDCGVNPRYTAAEEAEPEPEPEPEKESN
jgi:predicted Zn-dependent protease